MKGAMKATVDDEQMSTIWLGMKCESKPAWGISSNTPTATITHWMPTNVQVITTLNLKNAFNLITDYFTTFPKYIFGEVYIPAPIFLLLNIFYTTISYCSFKRI